MGSSWAQMTRHVVWAQVCFILYMSIYFTNIKSIYRIIYETTKTTKHMWGVWGGRDGLKRWDMSFGPGYYGLDLVNQW
jgi:hypothetical protein